MFDSIACASSWRSLAELSESDETRCVPASSFIDSCQYISEILKILKISLAVNDIESRLDALRAHVRTYAVSSTGAVTGSRAAVTIQQMLLREAAAAHSPPGFAVNPLEGRDTGISVQLCVTRLVWAMEFITHWLRQLDRDDCLSRATRVSYTATLSKKHPLPLRLAVYALSPLLPSKKAFLAKLEAPQVALDSVNSAAARNPIPPLAERLLAFAADVARVRAPLVVFLAAHKLDTE